MVFFTSDTHFNHTNIIKYCDRPFKDVNHMNEVLVANWNNVVGADDTVYFLGDWCMGTHEIGIKIRERLNGRIVLFPGNHDKCWRGNKGDTWVQWEKLYREAGFDEIVHDIGELEIEDPETKELIFSVRLSHFPYSMHDKRSFRQQRAEDDGRWLLHGHVHDAWKIQDRQINVGVDVWDYTPVPISRITAIILSSYPATSTYTGTEPWTDELK